MQSSDSSEDKQSNLYKKVRFEEFDCLHIVPFDNKSLNTDENPNPLIFKHPFFTLFLGPSRCGKTTAWMYMLKNKHLLYKQFSEVYFFVPTWYEDKIYSTNIEIEDKFIIIDYSMQRFLDIVLPKHAIIRDIIDEDNQAEIDSKLPRCLFVVDDNIGTKGLTGRTYNMMDFLATKGRKYNISVIYATQFLRIYSSRTVRQNMTDVCLFYMPNADEQTKILQEFRGNVSKKDIQAIYDFCFQSTNDKYNFLYIQPFNTDPMTKFRRNLNTILIPPSKCRQDVAHVQTEAKKRCSDQPQKQERDPVSMILSRPVKKLTQKSKSMDDEVVEHIRKMVRKNIMLNKQQTITGNHIYSMQKSLYDKKLDEEKLLKKYLLPYQ